MPQGSGHTPERSGGRRASSDLVRLYLQDIGRVDLLSHEEELTLARLVQRREGLLRERQRLAAEESRLAHGVRLQEGVMTLIGRLLEGADQAPSVLDHLAACEQELIQMEEHHPLTNLSKISMY